MTTEKKAREFWIYDVPSQVAESDVIRIIRNKPCKEIGWLEYHVIEKSAFDALAAELAHYKKLWTDVCSIQSGDVKKSLDELNALRAENEKLKKRLSAFDHNHVTRDIKPRGECPGCDRYHDKSDLTALKQKLEVAVEALEDANNLAEESIDDINRRLDIAIEALQTISTGLVQSEGSAEYAGFDSRMTAIIALTKIKGSEG